MTTAKYAALVEKGLKLSEIKELTPRQIYDIYFHRRDKEGKLVLPKASDKTSPNLAILLAMIEAGRAKASPEVVEKIRGRMGRHTTEHQ